MSYPAPDLVSNDFSDTGVWTLNGTPTHGAFTDPSSIVSNVSLLGDGVDNKITLTAGGLIDSGDGADHTFLIGFNVTTPNVDATTFIGQLDDGNSFTNNSIQIGMQSNGVLRAFFSNGLASPNHDTIASTGDVDYSDGVDRIMVVTVKGGSADVNIWQAKTTDALITEITYGSQDGVNNAGYIVGDATPQDLTIGGSNGAGNQFLSASSELSILRIWKSVALTDAQIQEVFDDAVRPSSPFNKKFITLFS